jgi:hypothetical protein
MAAPLGAGGPAFDAGLADHLRIGNETPVELGRCDCSLWVADWVRKRVGIDLAEDFRGKYRTRAEYLRLLIPMGGLVRVTARRMEAIGAEIISPSDCRPGDIGVIATSDGPALAVCGPDGWLAKVGDKLAAADHATFAWRLP